ncbi:MAG TPA: FAD-dependent oxidoreductase [Caulobacteraceae bacterium]
MYNTEAARVRLAVSRPLRIAVVGAGISGLSAAWLLSGRHQVTLFEAADRLGGHSRTIEVEGPRGPLAVDMGFIVYNEPNYPNLTALFGHLGVPTRTSNMGFGVSLDGGRVEYGGDNLGAFFAQWRNLVRPRFWSMVSDLLRFYRQAPQHACALHRDMVSLGDYLDAGGFGRAFQEDHLLPQAAAIWSASLKDIRDYPAASFIRFCENHGLLKVARRPLWRTVVGGSQRYVSALAAHISGEIRLGSPVESIRRSDHGVTVRVHGGAPEAFDEVVLACHADKALGMLADPGADERRLLSTFRYAENRVVLHSDPNLMPRRRQVWSAWNYIGRAGVDQLCVTYWMNRLQGLPSDLPLFVTLNPIRGPRSASIIAEESFDHPMFDVPALRAQTALWARQGANRTWWCGAHFGSGFHEDGLQTGLAVAEALGGVRRPWSVVGHSDRLPHTEEAIVAEAA